LRCRIEDLLKFSSASHLSDCLLLICFWWRCLWSEPKYKPPSSCLHNCIDFEASYAEIWSQVIILPITQLPLKNKRWYFTR